MLERRKMLDEVNVLYNKINELQVLLDHALNQLNESEWIPCSEGLPKKSDDYLTTTSFDLGKTEPTKEVYKNYFCAVSQKWLTDDEDVIAWMPLPKPYMEQK